MVLSRDEFQYFMEESYRKLKKKYGYIVASVFLEVLQREMKMNTDDIFSITYTDYFLRLDAMIETLELVRITTIPKGTPDYDVVKEISEI